MTRTTSALRRPRLLAVLLLSAVALVLLTACSASRRSSAEGNTRWRTVMSDAFDGDAVVKESMTATKSASPTWWLGSGGDLIVRDGVGSTIVGDAPQGYYRSRYALRNPVDTDDGAHPQNLFRLVTREAWSGETRQQAYFRILDYHLTDSPQRYDPNGLLLFNRYGDSMDLYYAGIRVDGRAVVKKKTGGSYYTLAEKKVFPGRYDRSKNPILLPRDRWIGLRAIARDNADGSVTVSLYMDPHRDGRWELLLEGTDAGVGGAPLRGGRGGIRTDFMDVQIDDYAMQRPVS